MSRVLRNMGITYDYYTIELREDTGNANTDVAIELAKKRAKLECIPCEWEASLVSDGSVKVFRVRRKRYRTGWKGKR